MKRALLAASLAVFSCTGWLETPSTPPGGLTPPNGAMPGLPGLPGSPGTPGTPSEPVDCSTKPLPPRRLRRLTRVEFDAAASAALEAPIVFSKDLAPDVVHHGFDTSDTLAVSPLFAEQLQTLGEALGAQVTANPARFGCNEATDACRDQFLARFGAKAFRRALSMQERSEYQALYELARADGHATAAGLVAAAMVQSPFFVYRSELGALTQGRWSLTPDELASALSFLITGAPPDVALLDAAAKGELAASAGRVAQAERLLVTAGANRQQGVFVERWLGLDTIGFVPKAGAQAQGFTPEVRASMLEEAKQLHGAVLQSGGGYQTLLSPGFGHLDATLANFLGLPAPTGQGFQKVDWSTGDRGGLLTLSAVMTVYGKAAESAPVQRGAAVRERVLCDPLPPPPPNVNAQPPAVTPGTTARDRFTQHTAIASCAGCHSRIDPIGFGLEQYDGVGRFRTTENGLPIDASGVLKNLDGKDVAFVGAKGLASALAGSAQAKRCYAKQWVRFGLGSDGTSDGFSCLSAEVETAFAAGTAPLTQVLKDLVRADAFQLRSGPGTAVAPPTEPPPVTPAADAGTPSTPTPMTPAGLMVTRKPQSSWETGFCEDVTVMNTSTAPIDWSVTLQVAGTLTQSWNSSYTSAAQGVTFIGASWNKTVAPGGSAAFGFCAKK